MSTASRFRSVLCCLALLAGAEIARAQDVGVSTIINLHPAVMLRHPQVRLGDIADIIDADSARRNRLAGLDLTKFDLTSDLTIQKDFVDVRTQLAGYPAGTILFQGAEKTVISAPVLINLTDLSVEQAVHESLCRLFQVSRDELNVKLVGPFMGAWLPNQDKLLHPRVEVVPPSQLPLGKSQLTLRILDGDRVVAGRPAAFEVSRKQRVVVATSTLNRSVVVNAEFVREEIRFVDQAVDQLTLQQVSGRSVVQPLKPGELVTLRHLSGEVRANDPIMVKARDAVRLTARIGKLEVAIPIAEAQEDGRAGQVIKVKNLQTGRIVQGKVVGPGLVDVPLQ